MDSIAFIGFGEASAAFAGCLSGNARFQAGGYDKKLNTDRASITDRFSKHGIQCFQSARLAVQNADIVISLVTADQATTAAHSANGLKKNCLFIDGNSCSTKTKLMNADIVTRAGGCYVDLAIMAPVRPDLKKVAMLVCGEHAADAHKFLSNLGLNSRVIDGDIGTAASIKMIRSIAIKGLEALVAECTIAGVRAGVDDQVFASLDKTFPGFGWADRSAYMLERMLNHGARRAAEMKEVAKTIQDLGMPNHMSCAAIAWHANLGATDFTTPSTNYRDLANQIIDKIKDP